MLFADAIDPGRPALIDRGASLQRVSTEADGSASSPIRPPARVLVIVTLDAVSCSGSCSSRWSRSTSATGCGSEYLVTIVRRDDRRRDVVYSVELRDADRRAIGRRDHRAVRSADGRAESAGGRGRAWRDRRRCLVRRSRRITIVRRSNGADGTRVLMAGGDDRKAPGKCGLRHRSGSLDTIVARRAGATWRSASACSGCSAASFVLVLASARAAAAAGASADGVCRGRVARAADAARGHLLRRREPRRRRRRRRRAGQALRLADRDARDAASATWSSA